MHRGKWHYTGSPSDVHIYRIDLIPLIDNISRLQRITIRSPQISPHTPADHTHLVLSYVFSDVIFYMTM